LEPEDFLSNHRQLSIHEKKRLEFTGKASLDQVLRSGAEILTEAAYPESLQQTLSHVSPAIFVRGDKSCLDAPAVGIVGTRGASPYGRACAQKFAEALAAAGVTIISGGALGIDAAAHKGALAASGKTAAVLAGGIDHIYPAIHAPLFREIAESGCLVSQFAAGARPNEYKFLGRNVLIAALSRALIVIQAPTRSGALSTAHAAADMGREVFVVPANIDSLEFRGSFNLIRDGATLVYHPDQVLEAIGVKKLKKEEPLAALSELGQRILDVLGTEPIDPERIVERTGVSAGEVLSELTMLELDGLVTRDSGGYTKKL
jgi:DNA processing protein